MRIVDADYAHKQLTIAEVECGKNFETDCNHVRDFLNALPTIDAVPVVRCKDCKYLNISCCGLGANDFCSNEERKDGEG